MTIQYINVGTAPNDGTGDSLRTAFITTNNNFAYIGNIVSGDGNLQANSLYVAGDMFALGNLYVGPGANTLPVVNPIFVGTDSGGGYVQTVIKNTQGTGSADITAFSNIGSDSGGWVSTGITGNSFNDTAYTITGNIDGYLFHQGYSGYGGNLVLATGSQGTYNDLVVAVGGFTSNKEVMRFSNSAQALQVKTTTQSTSTTTGALVVSGGAGVAGNAYVGGNVSVTNNVSATYLSGTITTAAQTNITSLGTLTGLTLSGGIVGTDIQVATVGNLGTLYTGNIATAIQPNIITLGNLTNISIQNSGTIRSYSGGYYAMTNVILISFTMNNGFTTNANAAYTMEFGGTGHRLISLDVNVNVTVSYSNVTSGTQKKVYFRNASGGTRYIVLPNSNNNKGVANITLANGTTSMFDFVCFSGTSANVAVWIANN